MKILIAGKIGPGLGLPLNDSGVFARCLAVAEAFPGTRWSAQGWVNGNLSWS